MKRQYLLILFLLLLLFPRTIFALGVFEEFGEMPFLLTAPLRPSVGASFLRTERSDHDASGYFMNAVYPLKELFLIRTELSYFVLAGSDGMVSGFGDFRIRGRLGVMHRGSVQLFLTAGLRSGSGARILYPYASASVDIQAGVGFVDSLSQFIVWGELSVASVNKVPEELKQSRSHEDFATVSLGMLLPVNPQITLQFGGAGYILRKGGSREIYFAGAEYGYSPEIRWFLLLQAEGGSPGNRLYDLGLRAGMEVFY